MIDHLNALRHGELSRRAFTRTLLAAGVGLVTTPLVPRRALAQGTAEGTFFT